MRLFVEAAAFVVIAEIALRVVGLAPLLKTLRTGRSANLDPRTARRIGQAVDRAGDSVRATCLRRAIAAAWMLRARGARPTLHYGVAKGDGTTIAHAWLELDGTSIVGAAQAARFTLLASFPEQQAGRTDSPKTFTNIAL